MYAISSELMSANGERWRRWLPAILRETGLSGEQDGFIISAFSIAYMLANPCGAGFWTARDCAAE